ncbi:UNVERIFIED_ORG: hypothetical protein M2438_005232 [Methylobacterium sp. SuP10 SLI 274]|uniref:hypothetical protein n=1 Tax=Methylorubrum TaxID=2282523 RepID=UPI00074FA799|nr:Transcriptional regulator [Methylobacterium sp. AMS5]MCP1551619.1 hypothetical protein [Methylorubrum zatmanii]MCP1556556.1 hypothetical protein [Methylorubrum extorquens]MDF9861183.1 hypothetical protein [Methylorubrum pseudosasae]MDH6639986.1 hypothetical protein [Methylobacterium sp. SuP10 SLI 274]
MRPAPGLAHETSRTRSDEIGQSPSSPHRRHDEVGAGAVGQREAVRAGTGIGILHDFAAAGLPDRVRILEGARAVPDLIASGRRLSRIVLDIGSSTMRSAFVFTSSFSESRKPPFGMML